ncbi:MAG TPA: NAD-dependent epimerase/dehydratase family protein [Gemmatimonadaceae bacterium]|nr:NAD-dependent epimerase/dehydratase family protein [Gemmatimonadaceae bacterium]
MPTVVVTGGAGFIGSHLAERFLREGWTVHVIDNLVTGKRENVPAGATLHELDIRDAKAAELIAATTPDVLAHLAAQMDVRRSVEDPVYDASVNVLGSLNLLEAVRRHSPRTRVAFASTGGALYGDNTTPPNFEEFKKDPESPYAISKLTVEYYLAYYGRVHRLDTVAMRFGNVYGPRQDPHGEAGVVAIFCGRILQGRPLTIFGDGQQTRDYVYVGDVAEALWHAATGTLPPIGLLDARGFNVGTGLGTSVVELANILLEEAGTTVPIEFAPKRPGEAQDSFVDIGKAERLLGWKPRVSLREGLAQSFRWAADRHAATAGIHA